MKKMRISLVFACMLFCQTVGAIAEKPMTIVIPSLNNKQWYEKNLASVFSQQYTNYRVIYIDDFSDDETAELVKNYVAAQGQNDRVTVIENRYHKGALANHYRAIHSCDDNEIIIQLDGDDWFAHDKVLSFINEVYEDPSVWITYGQYQFWPSGRMGLSKPVSPEFVRDCKWRDIIDGKFWTPGQLRTFYAWLGKLVKLEDCIFDGTAFMRHNGMFYPTNCDVALFIPMMEMAGEHHKFISDVIYIYNTGGPMNDFKVNSGLQLYVGKQIRSKPKYQPLQAPLIDRCAGYKQSKADVLLFVFEDDSVGILQALQQYVRGIHTIYVMNVRQQSVAVYDGTHEISVLTRSYRYETGFFKKTLQEIGATSGCDHIVLATDQMQFHGVVDMGFCITALEESFGSVFYLSRTKDPANMINIFEDELCAWYAASGSKQPFDVFCAALYRKQDFRKHLEALDFASIDDFMWQWMNVLNTQKAIALCYRDYRQPKVTFID